MWRLRKKNMNKTICTFWTSIVFLLYFNVSAQQRCSYCDIALNQQATDEFESKTSIKYDEATSELYSHDFSFWSTYNRLESHSASVEAGFSIFSASYGNSSGTTDAQQKFESTKDNYQNSHSLSQDEQKFISSKVASKTSYGAWEACVIACIGKTDLVLEKSGNNNDEFVVSLTYVVADGSASPTNVTNVLFPGFEFVGGDLKVGATLKPFCSLLGTFKRIDKSNDLTINVSADRFPQKSISIPKYEDATKDYTFNYTSSVPVGTVVAYAGNSVPPGWLLCDGSVVNETKYQALSYAIGTFWGNGDNSHGSFNLPDMRGMFLRGANGESSNDPDANNRTSTNGGSTKGVGTKQEDSFQGHNHDIDSYIYGGGQPGPFTSWAMPGVYSEKATFYSHTNCTATKIVSDNTNGNPRISKETRPKNVSVYYIIKY